MRSGVGGPAALSAIIRAGGEVRRAGDTMKKKAGAASNSATAWVRLVCWFKLGGGILRSTTLQQFMRRPGSSPAGGQQHFVSTVFRMLHANASDGPREPTKTANAAMAEINCTKQG